jgi:hypothetical protein
LLCKLQDEELVRKEMREKIGTTFKELLQRIITNPRWTPKSWFLEAIADYIQLLKNRPYLKSQMDEFCVYVVKTNLDRFPEIHSVMPEDYVRYYMKGRQWLTSDGPLYFGPL